MKFWILISVVGGTIFTTSCNNSCESYNNNIVRSREYNFTIDSLFRDPKNHTVPTIVYTQNGKKRLLGLFDIDDLYNAAEVGDSVSKASGQLEYKLFKKDTILSFYPFCDGKDLR
ncbi:hypothetical protein [Taibaiella soli]|uniref:Uncharacterized protein n=1 Tax=Taibaiella soli TaxID=1649169 RepID=A0A2W2AHZ3_9BACT|nr:hypothetical protein [Taibaiella soli]PZF71870.1 hypothetical protein DN068_17600 [Taibaiella soli]